MGERVIVEDDYIRPGDFRDANVRKALEIKAKKNVEKAEKRKASNNREKGYSPGGRKPSIASSTKKRSPKRSPKRSNDRSINSGKRKFSDVSSPGKNTPLNSNPANARPISQELDRESHISDPYKIMENQNKSGDSPIMPRGEIYNNKPMTAQTHPQ